MTRGANDTVRYGVLRCEARDAESRRVVVGRFCWLLVVLLLRVRG